ncbi:MAG: hypothetical protein IJE28_02385 [Oscillospiraceae bacterium]|nr:hypothetical protein [Oscillospiraceae bacterium]
MKKLIAVIILMAVLSAAFVSCGWNIEIKEPEETPEKEPSLSEEEENTEEEKTEPALLGDYIPLGTMDETSFDFLEFEDRIIAYTVGGDINAFDIETGEMIYSFYLGDVNENKAFEFIKTDEKKGFDYRVIWDDRIIYLSSKDPGAKEEILLPEQIAGTKMGYASYSERDEKIIWQCEEGVRMMDMKTGEESLILDNAIIDEKVRPIAEAAMEGMWVSDTGEKCAFEDPRFICGGRKIAVTAVTWDAVYWMLALYDIESGEFEWVYSFNEMVLAEYPISDKYVSIGKKWINAETGNYKNFEMEDYSLRSFDGIEFIKIVWEDFEGTGMQVFTGDFETIEEGGRKIAGISRESAKGHVDSVTENYIVIRVFEEESEGVFSRSHYIIKYR